MKKVLSLILMFVLCLSLCACGNPSKEKMNEMDKVLVSRTTIRENPVKAKEEYVGKVCVEANYVLQITSEYAEFGDPKIENPCRDVVRLYLPKEEIAQLKVDRYTDYIGLITDVTYDKSTDTTCVVANGYITALTEVGEFVVLGFDMNQNYQEYCVVTTKYLYQQGIIGDFRLPVFFEDESVLHTLKAGDEITLEYTPVYSEEYIMKWYAENAKIVESD